jgi:hypothetical protein
MLVPIAVHDSIPPGVIWRHHGAAADWTGIIPVWGKGRAQDEP